jgi:hypothetical protein
VTPEDVEDIRARFKREREEARKARRAEDKLRVERRRAFPERQRESRYAEIRRIAPETGRKPDQGGEEEVYTARAIANRASVKKAIAALRRAINKKSMGAARVALRELERSVDRLDPSEDAQMIKNAERLIDVARSRGVR